VHAARSLGAGPRALFLRIYLPSAMPMIATGLRIGLGQSWMAVVTAELIAAHSGLGYMIQANRLALETGLVLVGMCVIGLLGAAMSILLETLERHVLVPWKVH
jgi:ABC-type nitrate/sulfonate/bicarbonate transport system permease component